ECHFGNLLPFSSGKLPEYGAHFLTVGPLYHRHQAAFLPPCSLVGHYRVKLTLRQRGLVDAEMGPKVVREKYPVPGMLPLWPHSKVTQVVNVLVFKHFAVSMESIGKDLTAYRGRIQLLRCKTRSHAPVLRVPASTRCQSLLTFVPVSSLGHFLRLILR